MGVIMRSHKAADMSDNTALLLTDVFSNFTQSELFTYWHKGRPDIAPIKKMWVRVRVYEIKLHHHQWQRNK